MQKWVKIGCIYFPEVNNPIGYTYAAVPIVRAIYENSFTVLFTSRNRDNKSVLCEVTFCKDTFDIISETTVNLLVPGKIGEFDEDGVMASTIYSVNESSYLTYIGWSRSLSTPFRNAIGLAKIEKNQIQKMYNGPILDRSIYDPSFVASNCIIQKGNVYIMYYLSCVKWEEIDGILTHYYNIKIAESTDGLFFKPTGKIAIDFEDHLEYAISVPRVLYENGIYKMWYSYRGMRTDLKYRIGFAESLDGIHWQRKDDHVLFVTSEEGWDSEMLCYPYIFSLNNDTFMLYNGNGYGQTGFGIAKLEK